ncbi:hypothetical protein ACHAW6_006752 [Cyclotella cf. meneghiniana]
MRSYHVSLAASPKPSILARRWILDSKSCIIATPANRQSSNGLVECTWQSIICMTWAYITEKQVGRRLNDKLTSLFELVHGVKPDLSTWFELFSIGYFSYDFKKVESKSKMQAQTLDGIAVGCNKQSNTVTFDNPTTKQYYCPQSSNQMKAISHLLCSQNTVDLTAVLPVAPLAIVQTQGWKPFSLVPVSLLITKTPLPTAPLPTFLSHFSPMLPHWPMIPPPMFPLRAPPTSFT